MMETMIESTLSVQNPPGPMGCVNDVRWWAMYSEGFSYWAAMLLAFRRLRLVLFGIRHGDGRGEYRHRDHEGREERNVHDVPVIREHEPEPGDDDEDLDRFSPQHRAQRLPGRACLALRAPEPVDPTRHDVDGSPEGGGHGAVPSPDESCNQRERQGSDELPPKHDTDGLDRTLETHGSPPSKAMNYNKPRTPIAKSSCAAA